MVEIIRTQEPQALTSYRLSNPRAGPTEFEEDPNFRGPGNSVRNVTQNALNNNQSGLCIYCERELKNNEGHLEHVHPKAGPNGNPLLTFIYGNLAHSCDGDNCNSCGHKKQNTILHPSHIPGPGCNQDFTVSTTDGHIIPHPSVTSRQTKHLVSTTVGCLGLNKSHLAPDRKQWADLALDVLMKGEDLTKFLADKPFRYILQQL